MSEEFVRGLELLNERCVMHTQHLDQLAVDLKKAVFGNGTEGLGTRMTKVEISVQNMERDLQGIEEDRSKVRWAFYGILASLVVMLIGALGSQYMVYTRAQAVAATSQEVAVANQAILEEIKAELKGAN